MHSKQGKGKETQILEWWVLLEGGRVMGWGPQMQVICDKSCLATILESHTLTGKLDWMTYKLVFKMM